MTTKAEIENLEVSADVLGVVVGLSRRRVGQLEDEGTVVSRGRGRFPLAENVRRILDRTRDEKRKTSASVAMSEKDRLRAKLLEIEVAEREHRLIGREECEAVADEIVGTFRAELASLPSQISRDPKVRRAAEDRIDTLLRKVADRFEALGKELEMTGETSAIPSVD